jgi:hypothetical protein
LASSLRSEGVSATLNHLERLKGYGVNWRSFTEEYLDSCGLFRDAVLSILATITKQERVRRSERATAAISKLRRLGKTEHLSRPRLVVDRAKIGKLGAAGMSVRAIAAEFGDCARVRGEGNVGAQPRSTMPLIGNRIIHQIARDLRESQLQQLHCRFPPLKEGKQQIHPSILRIEPRGTPKTGHAWTPENRPTG